MGKACTYCNKLNHTAEVCCKDVRDKKTNKMTGDNTSSRGHETTNALTPTTSDIQMTETKEAKRDHFAYALNEENNNKEWNMSGRAHPSSNFFQGRAGRGWKRGVLFQPATELAALPTIASDL